MDDIKNSIFLKSSLRSPIRTLIVMGLCFLSVFTLTNQVFQMVIIERELERLSSYYRPIISFVPEDENEYDVSVAYEILQNNASIAIHDKTRSFSAIMEKGQNDEGFLFSDEYFITSEKYKNIKQRGLRLSDLFFIGKLISVQVDKGITQNQYRWRQSFPQDIGSPQEIDGETGVWLGFSLSQCVAGSKALLGKTSNVRVAIPPETVKKNLASLKTLELGDHCFVHTYYDRSYLTRKTFGEPEEVGSGRNNYFLLETLLPADNTLFYVLEEDEQLDPLTDQRFSEIWNEMKMLQANASTISLFTTVDMSGKPYFQVGAKISAIKEGRYLNAEDYQQKNAYCVIADPLAQLNGFEVGDILRLSVREPEQGLKHQKFLSSGELEKWQNLKSQELELRIVGIMELDAGATYLHGIFIPESLLSDTFAYQQGDFLSYAHYNIILDNDADVQNFMKTTQTELSAENINIRLFENNRETFLASAMPMRQNGRYNLLLFTSLGILSFAVTSFFYLFCRKKEIVILRSMGMEKKKIRKQILISYVTLLLPTFLLASFISYFKTLGQAEDLLSSIPLPSEINVNTRISIAYPIGLTFILLSLISAIFLFIVSRLLRKSVFSLLQDRQPCKSGENRNFLHDDNDILVPVPEFNLRYLEILEDRPKKTRHPRQSIARLMRIQYLRRRRALALLSLLIMVALISIISLQNSIMRNQDEINELYDSVHVIVDVISGDSVFNSMGYIRSPIIQQFYDKGMVESEYLVAQSERANYYLLQEGEILDEVETEEEILLTCFDQPDRFFYSDETGGPVESGRNIYLDNLSGTLHDFELNFEFLPGWDLTLFKHNFDPSWLTEGVPILVNNNKSQPDKWELGDLIGYPMFRLDSGFIPLHVVGIVSGRNAPPYALMGPLSFAAYADQTKEGKEFLHYISAELCIKPEFNRDLPELISEMQEFSNQYHADFIFRNRETLSAAKQDMKAPILKAQDDELKMVVRPLEKNNQLLSILFPICFILILGLIFFANFMLVQQRKQELEISRILGVPKSSLRTSILWDALVLTFISELTGLLLLIVTSMVNPEIIWLLLALCGCIFVVSIAANLIGVNIILAQSPLQMMQKAKEQ